MERHLATSAVDIGIRSKDATRATGVWTHTLILTGELTRRSTHTLELEIERLCGEGVGCITLDLRQLTSIDAIGAAVVAFRCGLCQRQGYGFSLIPGSRTVQRAFEQAGLKDVLPFQVDEITARRLKKHTSSHSHGNPVGLAQEVKQP
jgi:anti-anti-sigma factor